MLGIQQREGGFSMKLKQLSNKLNHKAVNVSHLYHIFKSKNVTAIKIFVKYI